ncbi:valine--tRNA ligase [Alicyclobacillus cellulosilyticus]|uniref:Valine--tRNA ligase n=1 Tax=Alicyclobacillus cellulosilyticus TaxID=1003997 RepID=A0A917K2K4_9BACL|nr:valine--tRNA ligase [Alicyclobacillus cellulosilyticus]GGI96305.1 valine--tRNA ligase [Alicyclobacillus cellulosilyticus]
MATARTTDLPTVYQPQHVEERIYRFWEEGGFFTPDPSAKGRPAFSVVMPPPNVTGSLHLGHAWNNTLQDILVRRRRMQGFDTVWVPGTDHAGIATQTRVEKTLLAEEGLTRHQLGRAAFVERVWAWKNRYGDLITRQVRALGASCDWTRERFTMDEGLSRAVREVFVRLYEEGLIYRGNRIINWCPRCGTALSDIEVEHRDLPGRLVHVAYPLADGSGELVVATTRPETMFADVAVAVHPEDPRYRGLIGRMLKLPLTDREIPVIADEYVDREYGTGCVKITPAHDPNDFEVGMRHQLPAPRCIEADGRLNDTAGAYRGMDRETARRRVVEDLARQGLVRKVEEISHAVGHCSRCDTVVEPYLSEQWFVRMAPLAEAAIAAVRRGELQFVPERFERVFLHWLENVRDWCISRQLWWGHRIPAWYCDACGGITVSRTDVTACSHCGSSEVRQDEDVLDTWFSSALWPFSTLGWPDATPDMARYYPTSVLVTAYDILFFWVARMVFTGLRFTGRMPFHTVVVHGLIRDAEGRKMSKSLGNGVDPVEVIEKYGADALRFTLATGTSPGNDQRFYWEKVEGSRNFINKVWNASRFVLMNLGDGPLPPLRREALTIADKWILHRLALTVQAVDASLDRLDFGEAGRALYDFAWDDFCDWYIELSKLSLYGSDEAAKAQTRAVLVHVLDALLRLLHPFIPFVTEEIWRHLPVHDAPALAVAAWPQAEVADVDERIARQMQVIQEAIRSVRNVRSERNVPPGKPVALAVRVQDEETARLFAEARPYLMRFCQLHTLDIGTEVAVPAHAVTAVVTGAELFIPLADLVDLAEERQRLEKERDRLAAEVERAEKKLANPQFVARAPAHVVEAEREKAANYRSKLEAVEERLRALAEGV